MSFEVLNIDKWDRKETFNHFMSVANCSYSITVNIDITTLHEYIKKEKLRFYPTFTWIVTRAVNSQKEFRMGYNEEGLLGYFNKINPSYSVLSKTTNIMSDLSTDYNENFVDYYNEMCIVLDKFQIDNKYKTSFAPNFFIVSCIPWLNYSSFNVNNHGDNPFLFPMVTWGKFRLENNKTYIPVTMQIHHAVADGYHCSLFYNKIEEIINKPEEYLNRNSNKK